MNNSENLIDIGGQLFTIDLESFTSQLTAAKTNKDGDVLRGYETETKINYDELGKPIGTTVITRDYDKGTEIDGPKYDVVRMCLEVLMTYNDEIDDSLGFENAMGKTSIAFKMAFNTLLNYEILKEIEE